MSGKDVFDPIRYYASYPDTVIARLGHPARAVYKSTFLFGLYGGKILRESGPIATYADIGGCFGFGANAMAYHIAKRQGTMPRTVVFEISPDFVKAGKLLFPHMEFVESEFDKWNGDIPRFDLVTLFDVVEHVVDPAAFLRVIAARSKYVMAKTPMETSGEWRGGQPPPHRGSNHPDGHVNFFIPSAYTRLLDASDLEIVESLLIETIVPRGSDAILYPEDACLGGARPPGSSGVFRRLKRILGKAVRQFPGVPWKLKRKVLGGGDHVCLCRSRPLAGSA